jgi:hypothetical protein
MSNSAHQLPDNIFLFLLKNLYTLFKWSIFLLSPLIVIFFWGNFVNSLPSEWQNTAINFRHNFSQFLDKYFLETAIATFLLFILYRAKRKKQTIDGYKAHNLIHRPQWSFFYLIVLPLLISLITVNTYNLDTSIGFFIALILCSSSFVALSNLEQVNLPSKYKSFNYERITLDSVSDDESKGKEFKQLIYAADKVTRKYHYKAVQVILIDTDDFFININKPYKSENLTVFLSSEVIKSISTDKYEHLIVYALARFEKRSLTEIKLSAAMMNWMTFVNRQNAKDNKRAKEVRQKYAHYSRDFYGNISSQSARKAFENEMPNSRARMQLLCLIGCIPMSFLIRLIGYLRRIVVNVDPIVKYYFPQSDFCELQKQIEPQKSISEEE